MTLEEKVKAIADIYVKRTPAKDVLRPLCERADRDLPKNLSIVLTGWRKSIQDKLDVEDAPNKRNTRNALAFEADAEANLLALARELRAHTYHPGRSICFVTGGPKPREVFAADFRDRIVHHLLVSHQERLFEPGFIHDSYACRRGKGTLAASDRLMEFLRWVTANGRRPAWALKLDVANCT